MEYKIINSVSELPAFDKSLPVFCDSETDGLYGPLRTLQVLQPQTTDIIYIIDIAPIGYNKQQWAKELILIEDFVMSMHTVWYNSSYDLGTLNISPSMGAKHPADITMDSKYEHRVDDLFYAVRTAYPEFMEFGLKSVVTKLSYTKDMYKGINTNDSAKGFIRGSYIASQAYDYAAKDVLALSLMWRDKKIKNVIENNLAYKVDMMSQAYALIYQQNGLMVDRELWKQKLEFAEKEVIKYTNLLPKGFNPNSYKQVRKLLNSSNSDNEALVTIVSKNNEYSNNASYIINAKKYKKQVSYLKSINFDKMYTKFNAAGAITGRFTSAGGDLDDGFNAQQIPRDFQKLFTQDIGDTTVIDLDYSTLELRLACAIYKVPFMYKQFKEGRDLHIDMAVKASKKSIAPDGFPNINHRNMLPWGTGHELYLDEQNRNDAKAINFGFVFGMSADSYVPYAFVNYDIVVTAEEAKELRAAYFEMYPELSVLHGSIWRSYKKPDFFVETALGRRVKPKLGTDGINIPIQGSGAETTKLGAHYMIKENPLALKYIYNVVHDAIYSRVPKSEKEYWDALQRASMLKGWTEISKTALFKYKDVPMEVE
jgi:DNA polymerase I-like protein with 3'-5' exonuclease and polymerase domains